MQTKLYVGNLSYETSENDLRTLFEKIGNIAEATVIRDRYSDRSKGFGFVELTEGADLEKAFELNGQEFMGRNIVVSKAKPPRDRHDRPRGGHRSGGGGGGGGGRRDRRPPRRDSRY